MSNFYQDVIVKSPWFHESHRVCNDLNMLEPGFRVKVAGFVTDAAAAGHKLKVLETFRSQTRQAQLFREKKTQLSKVGCHGYGVAVDLGLFDPSYDAVGEHYAFFKALCVQYRLISGIDWGTPYSTHNFHDWDHIQGVPVFRQNDLFAGQWFPPAGYDAIQDQIDHHITGV